ncbi:hypothetical protein GEMRC1_010952 [Eukaryota sp. GEM-RC1]
MASTCDVILSPQCLDLDVYLSASVIRTLRLILLSARSPEWHFLLCKYSPLNVSLKCTTIVTDHSLNTPVLSNSELLQCLRIAKEGHIPLTSTIAIPIRVYSHQNHESWPIPQFPNHPVSHPIFCVFLQSSAYLHHSQLHIQFEAHGPFVYGSLVKVPDSTSSWSGSDPNFAATISSYDPLTLTISSYSLPSPAHFYSSLCFLCLREETCVYVTVNRFKTKRSRTLKFTVERKESHFILSGNLYSSSDTSCTLKLNNLSIPDQNPVNCLHPYLEEDLRSQSSHVNQFNQSNDVYSELGSLVSDVEPVSFISSLNDLALSTPRLPPIEPLSRSSRLEIKPQNSLLFPQKEESNASEVFQYFSKQIEHINSKLMPEIQQSLGILCHSYRE